MAHGFKHGAGGDSKKVPILNESYPRDVAADAAGSDVTFSVMIAENGKPADYTYQWYYDDIPVSDADSENYTRSAEFGTHTVYCVVTNKAGMVTSRTATVTATKQYLYKAGDECSAITGGWIAGGLQSRSTYAAKSPSLNKGTSSMSASLNSGDTPSSGVVRASKSIDLAKYKTLYFDMSCTATQYNSVPIIVYAEGNSVIDFSGAAFTNTAKVPASHLFGAGKTQSRGTFAIDVSKLTGKYAIGVFFHYQSNKGTISANIYNVWGE